MIKKDKLIIECLLILSSFSFCSCKSQNKENQEIYNGAKQTVQKVFEFSLRDNYDSLRNIVDFFNKKPNEDLIFEVNGIKKIALLEGIPLFSELESRPFNRSNADICIIKFIPKHPIDLAIDSVIFQFDKFNGLKKVSFIDINRQIQLLKTN